MKPLLAAVLLIGLSVNIARGDDDPPGADPTLPPERDYRLLRGTDARTQRVGILTYYANRGGGYTFVRGKHIEFYALPNEPATYRIRYVEQAYDKKTKLGVPVQKSRKVSTIGTREMSFGCQTVYRGNMNVPGSTLPRREDTPIAKWTRDTPDGKFRLSLIAEDNETRLKLKSIVPVLEHGENAR